MVSNNPHFLIPNNQGTTPQYSNQYQQSPNVNMPASNVDGAGALMEPMHQQQQQQQQQQNYPCPLNQEIIHNNLVPIVHSPPNPSQTDRPPNHISPSSSLQEAPNNSLQRLLSISYGNTLNHNQFPDLDLSNMSDVKLFMICYGVYKREYVHAKSSILNSTGSTELDYKRLAHVVKIMCSIIKRASDADVVDIVQQCKFQQIQIPVNGIQVSADFLEPSDVHCPTTETSPFISHKLAYNMNQVKTDVANSLNIRRYFCHVHFMIIAVRTNCFIIDVPQEQQVTTFKPIIHDLLDDVDLVVLSLFAYMFSKIAKELLQK